MTLTSSAWNTGRPDNILVVDVGLSDHHLLQWSVETTRREAPVVATAVARGVS